jgi:hypothetical protein
MTLIQSEARPQILWSVVEFLYAYRFRIIILRVLEALHTVKVTNSVLSPNLAFCYCLFFTFSLIPNCFHVTDVASYMKTVRNRRKFLPNRESGLAMNMAA